MKTIINICLFLLFSNGVFGGIKVSGTTSVTLPPNSHFGWSVSISGDFAAVAAPNESYDSIISSGAIYIYKIENDGWKYFQRIVPSDPSIMKLFGASVKLSGSTLMAGAPNDNGKFGSVYIFTFNNVSWEQSQKIMPLNPVPFQMFGTAVDIGSGYALISSVSSQNNEIGSGSVYVYRISSNNWIEESVLNSPETNVHDLFGAGSAIISSDHFIVSAPRGNGLVENSGVLYSYIKQNGEWVKNQKIESPNGRKDGLFGSAISYSENRLLVGAMQEMVDSVISGAAYFYKLEDLNNWSQEQKVYPEVLIDHDYFGIEVELNNEVAIIGSPKWESERQKTDMGCVDLFRLNENQWELTKKIIADDGDKDDHYGMAIAMDKSNLVVGARLDDNSTVNSGSAFFYNLNSLVIEISENKILRNYSLDQNYPNPFNQATTIYYSLPEKTHVVLSVFDLNGHKIIDLLNGTETAGFGQVVWNGKNTQGIQVPPGTYVYQMKTDDFEESRQMIIFK